MFEDSRNGVWFKRGGGGALRYREGAWTEHGSELPGGELEAGLGDGARDLWFGASGGLHRLHKRAD